MCGWGDGERDSGKLEHGWSSGGTGSYIRTYADPIPSIQLSNIELRARKEKR